MAAAARQAKVDKINAGLNAFKLMGVGYQSLQEFLGELLSSRHHYGLAPTVNFITKWICSLLATELEKLKLDPRCRLPVGSVEPSGIRGFNFPAMAKIYSEIAPTLWNLVCTLADVSPANSQSYINNEPRDRRPDPEDEASTAGSNAPQTAGSGRKSRPRESRDKALNATIIVGLLGFSKSRRCNRLQSNLGYYLFATRTGKRTIAVLNRLGLSVSYTYIISALRANAERVCAMLMSRALNHPVLYTYCHGATLAGKQGHVFPTQTSDTRCPAGMATGHVSAHALTVSQTDGGRESAQALTASQTDEAEEARRGAHCALRPAHA